MKIFPLPLTAFEELMLLDNALPMDMWVEGCFDRPLERPALQQALQTLLERHPLLSCRPEPYQGQLCWVPVPRRAELVVLDGQDWPNHLLRPDQGEGMRGYVKGNSVYLHVHHACCDGTGLRLLFQDLAAAYLLALNPQATTGFERSSGQPNPGSERSFAQPSPEFDRSVAQAPALSRLEPERLLTRGRLVSTGPALAGSSWRQLKEIFHFLFPWPQPLAKQPGSGHGPPFSKRIFTVESNARRHHQALSHLFCCLADWQRAHHRRHGRLRILIPWDQRELTDRRAPACNRVSFVFLSRLLRQCVGDLSTSLAQEHEYVRVHRTDQDFLKALEWARQNRLLKWLLRLPLSLSSAVFTNMGDVTPLRGFPKSASGYELGGAVCQYVTGATAVRPGTSAAFSLCQFDRQLAVGLRCDRRYLSFEAEQHLLDDFTRRLQDA